jgi:hypothetical protein
MNIIWPDSVVVMVIVLHAEGRKFKSNKDVILIFITQTMPSTSVARAGTGVFVYNAK